MTRKGQILYILIFFHKINNYGWTNNRVLLLISWSSWEAVCVLSQSVSKTLITKSWTKLEMPHFIATPNWIESFFDPLFTATPKTVSLSECVVIIEETTTYAFRSIQRQRQRVTSKTGCNILAFISNFNMAALGASSNCLESVRLCTWMENFSSSLELWLDEENRPLRHVAIK